MTTQTHIKSLLLLSLFTLGLGGLLLHLRIHPTTSEHAYNAIPLVAGILSVLLVPVLFSFKRTLDYGYILNGFLVIIGTITMAQFSIVRCPRPVTAQTLVLMTTLADILILFGKFLVGKALFGLERHGYAPNLPLAGKSWRYPNLGWWLIHLIAISAIYALGNRLWR